MLPCGSFDETRLRLHGPAIEHAGYEIHVGEEARLGTVNRRHAELRRKCPRPVMPRIGRDVTWAAEMVKRAQAGERVPRYNLRLALDALGLQGPLR